MSEPQQTDLLAVIEAGSHEPPETSLRLEILARGLAEEISADPKKAAEAFVELERDRMLRHRQLNRALVALCERNAQLKATEAALEEAAEMVYRLQQSPHTRLWRWWRRS